MTEDVTVDVLVVGAGIAGLTAALSLASLGRRVRVVTKSRLTESSTWYAQGGIAGAVGEADSVELHVADTLVVGQGLCDEAVVRALIEEAPEALSELRSLGVRFDLAESGAVALAREGGHSLPRILHSGDATGAAILSALVDTVRTMPDIEIVEGRFLVDLLLADGRCLGCVLFAEETGVVERVRAEAVVLATGGAGQAYRVTTNPAGATGDGIAAAWRAGAELIDMEFVQFHPTALDHDAHPRFLITEALRGEGAYLLDCDGQRFMPDVHPLAELAPRDVVSREIERVMQRCGRPNVWLDARHLGGAYLAERFPNVAHACADAGYDIGRDLVPVAPAAHYLIGGIRVDIDGRSSLDGLWASGECAASGLHGANRLASNSLLEGLVISRRAARAIADEARGSGSASEPVPSDWRRVMRPLAPALGEIQSVMSRAVGVTRTGEGLRDALDAFLAIQADAPTAEFPTDASATFRRADAEADDVLLVSRLIAEAAFAREESRGCHGRADFPERDDERWRTRIVWRRGEESRQVPVAGSGS